MKQDNTYLQNAKRNKYDEFYTTYECIDEELVHYSRHFDGKTVLCNCDDPWKSNFCKYFLRNFNNFGIKRLICTSFHGPKICDTGSFASDYYTKGKGLILDVSYVGEGKNVFSMEYIDEWLKDKSLVKPLKGNGDFRSEECVQYLKEADIVVTNPPFSLFREMISILVLHNKKFLLIGNQNALTYKEIFPLVQKGLVWTGYKFGDMKFRVPADSEPRKTRFWIDKSGQKWRSLGNAMWLTNLDIERIHDVLPLTKRYYPSLYPKYDNYDAINVDRVDNIPMDYPGVMGVPLTVVNKFNTEQFEIIGEANHGQDNEFDLFVPTVKGKLMFKKILIKNKKPVKYMFDEFKILDLFCGAGGFSYGMEKNPHFKTVLSVDNDPYVAATFKHNFPECEVVIGDINESKLKQEIVSQAERLGVNMIIGGPPCQGYSNKGKKLGLKDPRNFLFREYLSLVERLRPVVFVIENVKTLLSASNGWFRDEIVKEIGKLGYKVEYGVLNASDFGVPQNRERAIFICSLEKNIPLPEKVSPKTVTVRDAISDLAYLESGEGTFEQEYAMPAQGEYQSLMRRDCNTLFNHVASKHKKVAIDKLKMIPPECGKEYIPVELRGKQKFNTTWGRLKWNEVSPTIDTRFDAASNGTNNHPFLNRAITPREAARIQSFDDSFVFLGSKVRIRKQVGNAVPPLLSKAIAERIFEVLNNIK